MASVAFAGIGMGSNPPEPPEAVLVFTGDIHGYLSPCGCTSPQIGGIRRMAGVVRALLKQPHSTYVDIGNWAHPGGRQDELKAEAAATLFYSLRPAYLNVGQAEATLGASYVRALNAMTGNRMKSSTLSLEGAIKNSAGIKSGQLFIEGSLPGGTASDAPEGFERVLLFAGPRSDAAELADSGLIVYSTSGDPPRIAAELNGSVLVSPGDRCRYVGRIEFSKGKWQNFSLIQLGPDKVDDPGASQIYADYQHRVAAENLLAELPKTRGPIKFVGSKLCSLCHGRIYRQWEKTAHALAYRTLQAVGNSRDPECVGCHVVGLVDITGFASIEKTPRMAAVGCENCHGPGGQHAKKPYPNYPRIGEDACIICHNSENSPNFSFAEYWRKIEH
jgi:hypothetical protein